MLLSSFVMLAPLINSATCGSMSLVSHNFIIWHPSCTCLPSRRENTEKVATGRRELIFNTAHTTSIPPAASQRMIRYEANYA